MKMPISNRRWAIAKGYVPGSSNGPEPQFTSHETACLLNMSDEDAQVEIPAYFCDRDPVGPYLLTDLAWRTCSVRIYELEDTDYASVVESDVPIVVHTPG